MLISQSLINNILTRLKVVFNVKNCIILYFLPKRNSYATKPTPNTFIVIHKYNTNPTIAVALIWIGFYTQYYYLI